MATGIARERKRPTTTESYKMGDEFPRRLCDALPPVTAVLFYRWLAAGLHDKTISQGVGGHRVYVGIRHPYKMAAIFQLID